MGIDRVALRFDDWVVCTRVTVCFSSLLPSDSILKACGRGVMRRVVARGRICVASGSGVDVMTSLVGDDPPAVVVVPSFCREKVERQFSV